MNAQQATPRRDRRTTDTRRRIESTALRMFVSNGFAETSLKDIAEELGITKAAVYYHFPAKADLARSVFQPFINDVDALLESFDHDAPSRRDVLTAYAEALLPHRLALTATLRDPTGLAGLDVAGASDRWRTRLVALLFTEDTAHTRVRATVALGGLTRALQLPEIEDAAAREIAIDAAVDALG